MKSGALSRRHPSGRRFRHPAGAFNRLREDEDACYEYDENGNLIAKTAQVGVAGCIGGVTSYEWDVLNRLVRIDNPDGTYSAYRYDAQGRRIEKNVNGALTKYVYDGDAILLEFDGANSLQARYSHGEEIDQPLAMTRGGDSYFYGVDHLGSIRLVTDAAGAVANRYDYDAFGNLEATSYETVTNPFGFTARERDAESGLMFYRARYYDPKIGRFISEDPIGFEGKDLNLYRYVYNGPLLGTDPTGNISTATYFVVANTAIMIGFGLMIHSIQEYTLQNSASRWCAAGVTEGLTAVGVAGGFVAAAVMARSPQLAPLALATAAVSAVANFVVQGFATVACHNAWPKPDSMPIPDGNDPTWGTPYPAPPATDDPDGNAATA